MIATTGFRLTPMLSLLVTGFVAACAPPNARLVAPNEPDAVASAQEGEIVAEAPYQPKIDVLFVIDNSMSMTPHQERLKENIAQFVNEFDSNAFIDFHVGVVSIWDRIRIRPDRPNYWPIGKLKPLKDNEQPGRPVAGPSYVTRLLPDYTRILGDTILLGELPPKDNGPEFEEMFTPVLPALDARVNPGFIRPDAHLAVIFLTDADDSSLMSEGDLVNGLVAVKGGDKNLVSAYGVLSYGSCTRDYGLRPRFRGDTVRDPVKIMHFLHMMNGQIYNLCSNHYGAQLANAGMHITRRAMEHMPIRIKLAKIPEYGSLQVRIQGHRELLPEGEAWTYDPGTNSVIFNGTSASLKGMTGKIQVRVVPINRYSEIDSGRVHGAED